MIYEIFEIKSHDVIRICVVASSLLNRLPQNFSCRSQKTGYAVSEKIKIILSILVCIVQCQCYVKI